MSRNYYDIAFTDRVRAEQERDGSRAFYGDGGAKQALRLSAREADFLHTADHFFQATVGETGWPYVQHRGGAVGFIKVLGPSTIGFANLQGNRQLISVGNLRGNNRIALIVIDYVNRRRLKIMGTVQMVSRQSNPALLEQLTVPGYPAVAESAVIIEVAGFDWNCPQHITQRYTRQMVDATIAQVHAEYAEQQARRRPYAPAKIGKGPLALLVRGIEQATPGVRVYTLASADGAPLPVVAPGTHCGFPVILENGAETVRRFSLMPRDAGQAWEIAVQASDHPSSATGAINDGWQLGTILQCEPAENHFGLHDDGRPACLFAAGIGITPIRAMARALLARGAAFTLHYLVRNRSDAVFAAGLAAELGKRFHLHVTGETGRPSWSDLFTTKDAVCYVCGPTSFIADARSGALQAGIDDVRFERFVAATGDRQDQPLRVWLARSKREIQVPAHQSILQALDGAGIAAPASCRSGQCGTCAVNCSDGVPEHRDEVLTLAEQAAGRFCPCVSRAKSTAITLDI